jgi:hypothetical protein
LFAGPQPKPVTKLAQSVSKASSRLSAAGPRARRGLSIQRWLVDSKVIYHLEEHDQRHAGDFDTQRCVHERECSAEECREAREAPAMAAGPGDMALRKQLRTGRKYVDLYARRALPALVLKGIARPCGGVLHVGPGRAALRRSRRCRGRR